MNYANSQTPVLLVDDDEDDFLIIQHLINTIPDTPFTLEWASNSIEAARLIKQRKHEAYLVDYRLNDISGLELMAQFDIVDRKEPFIILTGVGDERVEKDAMQMGAADYLVKGSFDSELLARVLRHSIQRKTMEAERVEQLIELNRSKDEFIAIASHQLRTPATAVKQYISMVLEGFAGAVSEEQAALLKTAYDDNERQIQIVNDILRVAKLDLEKIELEKQSINASKKVKNVVRDLAPQLEARRQTIIFNEPKEPMFIHADKEYIRMALANILDNASKYTPEGKSIQISIAEAHDDVAISFKDEGVGIDRNDLSKLFKKFSRIDNPLSVQVGGTGLGLYWSNEIIELHGGNITVDSAPAKGSTFTVTLPKAAPIA